MSDRPRLIDLSSQFPTFKFQVLGKHQTVGAPRFTKAQSHEATKPFGWHRRGGASLIKIPKQMCLGSWELGVGS